MFDEFPDDPEYLYPPGADSETTPSTFTFAFASNLVECWSAGADVYPPVSGAEFLFCPAGALSSRDRIDGSAYVDQDRVYITQEQTDYPYLCAAE